MSRRRCGEWAFRGVLALLLTAGCAPDPAGWQAPAAVDREPPVLLAVEPEGPEVEPETCFLLCFSEPLNSDSLAPAGPDKLAGVVLLVGAAGPEAVAAAGEGACLEPEAHPDVEAAVELEAGGTTVRLCPREALAEEQQYTLVATRRLRDLARNPLGRSANDPSTVDESRELETTFAGLRVAGVEPADGAVDVPPNLAIISVTFMRPVDPASVDAESFQLRAGGERLPLAGFTLSANALQVSAALPASSALALGTEHEVQLSTDLRDAARGRRLVAPWSSGFITAATVDEQPPGWRTPPVVSPEDVLARLSGHTDEPASLQVACSGPRGPGPDLDEPGLAEQWEVLLAPLVPDSEYRCEVVVADAVGNRSLPLALDFVTTAPQGRPVITEVLANPVGAADEEHGREYVELYNAGSAAVALDGFFLDDKGDATGADLLAPADEAAVPALLPPGRFALVVSTAYEGAYELPAEVLLLVVDDSRLGSDGLAQSDSVELYAGDPATGAARVSSYGGWHKSSTDGAAVERCDPTAPDEAASWVLRSDGGTPGAGCESSASP